MDLTKLKGKIREKEETAKNIQQSSANNNNNFDDKLFKVTFLPEGEHRVRIIPDANSDLVHIQYVHRIDGGKKRIRCDRTDRSMPMSACPICAAIKQAEEQGATFDYKFKRAAVTKMLVYLYDTKAPSEYWTPGNFYLVIANSFLFNSVSAQIASILNTAESTGDDSILEIFNPTAPNQYKFIINHIGGNSGNTTFAASPFERALEGVVVPEDKLIELRSEYIDDTKRKPEDEAAAIESIVRRGAQAAINSSNVPPQAPAGYTPPATPESHYTPPSNEAPAAPQAPSAPAVPASQEYRAPEAPSAPSAPVSNEGSVPPPPPSAGIPMAPGSNVGSIPPPPPAP